MNSDMRSEVQILLNAAQNIPADELPRLLGQLEEVRCTAMARLSSPQPAKPQADELLSVEEAARRLGMSRDYLYRNHKQFPFARHMGRRLLFSALGIEKHIRQKAS